MENKLDLYGIYPATVASTQDPQKLGRVKLRIGAVLGTVLSDWAPSLGEVNTPVKQGDYVLAQFIGGDVRYPVYSVAIGSMSKPWEDASPSPTNTVTGMVTITPVPNTPTAKHITYDLSEYTNIYGFVTAQTAVPGTVVSGVGITNLSTTAADIYITRTNDTDTNVFYMIYGTN